MNLERFTKNPLLVLGLTPGASRMDIERTGQKLLGLLSIGAESAKIYATPWGPQPRDESLVRQALAELKDPAVRLRAELWALEAADALPMAPAEQSRDNGLLRTLAFRAIGWRSPCTSS